MDCLAKAERIMHEARDRLRELAAESLESNDFEAVRQIAEIANAIESIIKDRCQPEVPEIHSDGQPKRPPAQRRTQATRKAGSRRPESGSPLFCRQQNDLVKIGKSKRGKGPYEHRTPGRVLTLLASRIASNGSAEKLFRLDDLLPLRDPASGADVPGYQAYVCLGWLKSESLVRQHGRRGYTVPDPRKLVAAVESRFQKLPAR
jgi:hypothetical protein